MLTSLVKARFLVVGQDHRYRLGLKLLQLGNQAEESISLSTEVQAILDGVSYRCRDATHFGILADSDVLYLAKARGHRGIEMASRPGATMRAQNTAMGKVLLSQLPEVDAVERFDPAAARTPYSMQTVDQFLAGLDQARRNGYAFENQENELGVSCVAICAPDLTGASMTAMSISAPSVYMTDDRIPELVDLLREVQPELTRRLPRGFRDAWL